MGWGCNAEKRDAFLQEHKSVRLSAEVNPDATMVCIDGNAAARGQAVGLRPATLIARHILKPVTAITKTAIICFDNSNIPDIRRHEVHVARQAASRETAATPEQIAAFTDGSGTSWESMFASSKGKVVAFKTIIRAMKEFIIRSAVAGCTYLITMPGQVSPDCPKNFIWSYPFHTHNEFYTPLLTNFYGEAEAQLAVCIKHAAQRALSTGVEVPRTALYTIDTDCLYQMLGLWHPRLEVVLGMVWQISGDQKCFRSVKKAQQAAREIKAANKKRKRGKEVSAAIERKYRRVSISQLAHSLCQGSMIGLANTQWWLLLAGGCDYNLSGLSGFGWFNATCLKLQKEVVIDQTGLKLHKFAALLLKSRNNKRQEREVAKFCDVLARTVFSWRYYQWEDTQERECKTAEPPFIKTLFRAGDAETITAWLRAIESDVIVPVGWRPALQASDCGHSSDRAAARAYCT